ncbi:MAG: XdhC family protein [Actinomycetota bacterium]|nr:XdhC family protein [Actinomycetota bacterium]
MTSDLHERIAELTDGRVPFVRATVVRAQFPTSAHPGDLAIVLADGSIEGFVGGQCATGTVRTAALGALRDGQSVLLRVLPDGGATFPELPGAEVVVNPCLSGGALEIFLEPLLPSPTLHLVGSTPTAEAVASLATAVGFGVTRASDDQPPSAVTAVLLAGHGGDEARVIRAALDAGVGYIGVVASRTRAQGLLDAMGCSAEERQRIHAPVGIHIGARTAAEIALSVVAGIVRAIRLEGLAAPAVEQTAVPAVQVDPICGMSVTTGPDTPHLLLDGQDVWFCGTGCRDAYAASR